MENEKTNLPQALEKIPDVFSNAGNFEHIQRVAKALSASDLVPKTYKDNISNTIIALDIANRIGAAPLMIMQHLYIVNGKPSWSSTFLIAAINNSGRFTSLKFEVNGEGDQRGCVAYCTDKETGERLESPKVSIDMAKKEGWLTKAGSKWQTMPELMMRYRSAAFFSRLYCPEITMGMQTVEEIQDVEFIEEKNSSKLTDVVNKAKAATGKQSQISQTETTSETPKEF